MLLRKHLIGYKIKSISSNDNLERIIKIELEGYNELNDLTTKYLIVELMGKHSNITVSYTHLNYDNGMFFSNISKLSIGDKIKIYDLNNNFLEYNIYDKFEVEINNTSVLNQDTNGKKELTLITCNNKKKNSCLLYTSRCV